MTTRSKGAEFGDYTNEVTWDFFKKSAVLLKELFTNNKKHPF